MEDDGPQIFRPIPRRPFASTLINPTSEGEDSTPPTPNPNANLDFSCLLPPFNNHGLISNDHLSSSNTLSRPASYRNLTSSALLGIFSPSSSALRDAGMDSSESVVETPWGSGAETPIHRPGLDEATLELMQARSGLVRRRSSHHTAESISTSRSVVKPPPAAASPLDLVARAALLFILGVGYGALVTRFHSETVVGGLHKGLSSSITTPSMDWKFQIFWGMSGVFLGAALPWADKMWKAEEDDEAVVETCVDAEEESSDDDWMSVMRPIAAFVGIFFAIRKLAWTSPFQIVFTLAATNPLLWWLIDRTVPGFFLSAFIGISGSAFLLGTNPSVIATPSGFSTLATHNMNSTMNVLANDNLVLGGLANQTTLEAGMWIASVLFCSCLCFGNIGRRLAQSSAGKS